MILLALAPFAMILAGIAAFADDYPGMSFTSALRDRIIHLGLCRILTIVVIMTAMVLAAHVVLNHEADAQMVQQ